MTQNVHTSGSTLQLPSGIGVSHEWCQRLDSALHVLFCETIPEKSPAVVLILVRDVVVLITWRAQCL